MEHKDMTETVIGCAYLFIIKWGLGFLKAYTLLNSLMEMYFTYVLESQQGGKFYTGFTKDIKLRFEQHNKGLVESTKDRIP